MRIWVNGCFDVLHLGHVRLLSLADNLGVIRIGLDSDAKVRADKGPDRPLNSFADRKEMLQSLKYNLWDVVSFDTNEELEQLIKDYQPHVLLVGEEYRGRVVGAEHAHIVQYFPIYGNHSTTRMMP